MGESDPFAEDVTSLNIFASQVDARNPTFVAAGDETCRSTKAAPDVQDVIGGIRIELGHEFLGGFTTANVEFIDRCEIVDGDGGRCLAHQRKTILNRGNQI